MSSEFMGKTYRRMDDMVLDANLRVTGDALFGYFESATRFVIVVNTGGVTFS